MTSKVAAKNSLRGICVARRGAGGVSHMRRFVLSAQVVAMAFGFIACSNNGPMAPAALSGPSPIAAGAPSIVTGGGGQLHTTQIGHYSSSERDFASSLGSFNQAILAISGLEASNGDGSAQVRWLAQQIVQDYSAAQSHLNDLLGNSESQQYSMSS